MGKEKFTPEDPFKPQSPYSSFTGGAHDNCMASRKPSKERIYGASVIGNSAAELEEKILAEAREVFGEAVELEIVKGYRVDRTFMSADEKLGRFSSRMKVRVVEPKVDERTVIVSAEGNNVTELEQDALARATQFFITYNGDQFDLSTELEIVPDYRVVQRTPGLTIEGVLPFKDWTAEVLVRVARSPKPVKRDKNKPVFQDGDFKVYETDFGTFVSADQGGWLPGAYSSPRVAEQAWRFLDITELENLWVKVNREGRIIKAGDLPPPPADPEPEENE